MKIIKNWEELSKLPPNDKYRIIVKDCCGWIVPLCDIPDNGNYICKCENDDNYFENHIYIYQHILFMAVIINILPNYYKNMALMLRLIIGIRWNK